MATKDKDKDKENTKVLVRLLPATLSSEGFWKLIEEKVVDKILHWYYVPGKTGPKKYVNSRAYIYFKTHDAVCEFNEKFNGHIFVNSKGVEERAMVEYAPYQRLPKVKKRPDLRMGSIAEDPDYLSFIEKTKEQPAILPSAEVQLDKRLAEEKEKIAAAGGVMPAIVTPLMEDIRAKRAARNAPRTILQAPKRRGDRADKKRATKDDKAKTEAKANSRDRNSRRRRDRDERKKKKKDKDEPEGHAEEGQAQPQASAQHAQSSGSEKGGKSRNGLWTIRNHISNLEPGSITIQTRGVGSNAPAGGKPPTIMQHPSSSPAPSIAPTPSPLPLNPPSQPIIPQQAPQQGQGRKPRDPNPNAETEEDVKARKFIPPSNNNQQINNNNNNNSSKCCNHLNTCSCNHQHMLFNLLCKLALFLWAYTKRCSDKAEPNVRGRLSNTVVNQQQSYGTYYQPTYPTYTAAPTFLTYKLC